MTRFLPLLVLAACSDAPTLSIAPAHSHSEHAVWANGDFESDALNTMPPTSWTLVNHTNNKISGTASAPPSTFSALNLTTPGSRVDATTVVGGSNYTQVDPDLGSGQTFRFPIYGQRSARVNYKNSSVTGKDKNVNVLSQTQTIALADIDPVDQQPHVRFAIAPVLEVPTHSYTEQPYYYVQLQNLTRNTLLYTAFNVAGQAGVPWKTTKSVLTATTTQWLDWQLVDIAPGNANLAVGDSVQLTIVAAGCSLGGHFGRIYVDGIGPTIPGIFASATAPATVNAGATLTYTVNYSNGGTSSAVGVRVDMVTPPSTTFASSAGATCSAPAAGATGTVSCALGTLAPGSNGSFTVTVNVGASATGSVVNGNYSISAVNAPTLLGSKVTTKINSTSTVNADLVVTHTASTATANAGQVFTSSSPLYTIKLRNNSTTTQMRGTTGTLFTDTFPSQLTNVSWSCAITNTGSAASGTATKCRDASGSGNNSITGTGNISIKPRLGYNGGEVTYTVWGTVAAAATGSVVNTAALALPGGGANDPNPSNNSGTTTVQLGTPRVLSLTKTGAAYGSITSSPVGLSCTAAASCASASASFPDGSQVLLTASPAAGATFAGWTGACTGTGTQCTITMNGAQSVGATFNAPAPAGTAAHIYVYRGNNQLAPSGTAFATPLSVLVTDASGAPKSGVTVTFSLPASGPTATLSSNTASTDAAGIATITTTTAGSTPGPFTVGAAITGSSTSFSLTNVGGPATITYVSGGQVPEPQLAPVNSVFASPLIALVQDAAGNPVSGASVTYAVTAASGATATLSQTTAITDVDGFASVVATANGVVGSYTATASIGGESEAIFNLSNVSTGPAAIYIVSGNNQTAATSVSFAAPLVVVVADSVGNSLPGVQVSFTVTGANAAIVAPSGTVTDAVGQTSVGVTAGTGGGSTTVTASVTGVTTPAVFALTIDGGQTIEVSTGSPQSASVGTPFPTRLRALVTDANEAPVVGVVVTFSAPTGGASATLSSVTATTDATGVAGVSGTAGTLVGSYTVTASTPNATARADFALSNTVGPAARLARVSGSPQTALVGSAFSSPLVVAVTDSYDNPITGATVSFTAPVSGATARLSSPGVTDASGQTSVTAEAIQKAGTYEVVASGASGTTGFTLTNGCSSDKHCASTEWCSAGVCLAKQPNDGSCTASNGCLSDVCHSDGKCGYPNSSGSCIDGTVCRSGVCGSDDVCGYPDQEGVCAVNTPAPCRSGACSVSGTCQPAGGCLVHGDCAANQYCNALSCHSDLPNDSSLPVACTVGEGAAICQSGVCHTDDKCGYPNAVGVCADGTDCRSGVCGDDGLCGYENGGGVCTDGDAATVCRGGSCSATAFVCKPTGGCAVDQDCGGTQWCNDFVCVSKLPNGDPIPSVTGHAPALTGVCTEVAAQSVCASGVCDTDHKCGFGGGNGACTSQDASGCRSGLCSATSVCREATTCYANADCDTQLQFCATPSCEAKRPNGADCHDVTMCESGICTNGKCGRGTGEGPCDAQTAGDVCRSSTCSPTSQVCIPADGCAANADCQSDEFCSDYTCVPKRPNGGDCSADAQCSANVCHQADGKCGYPSGAGACTGADTVCRSNACSANGTCRESTGCLVHADCTTAQYCDANLCVPKVPNDQPVPGGVCDTVAAQTHCASGVCDSEDARCGHALTRGVCEATPQCRAGVCSPDGVCVACVTSNDCGSAQPVCTANTCVQCSATDATACVGATPVCDVVSNHCIAAPAPTGVTPPVEQPNVPEPPVPAACSNDSDCDGSSYCGDESLCLGRRVVGQACSATTQCQSELCGIEGVCVEPATTRLYVGGNGFGRGCGATPASLWWLLAVGLAWRRKRRA